jgi:Protein of unknown function (DUF4230)
MHGMRRVLLVIGLCFIGFAAGAAATLLLRSKVRAPDPAAVAAQVREVARLETLEVTLYKKISFSPDPEPQGSLWSDVGHWLLFSLRKPEGRAIVFARARLGLDLEKLDTSRLRIVGDRIELSLPPLSPEVELLPGDTEIIGSNLDSTETSQLFEHARQAFLREVSADKKLHDRARRSSERALRGLLVTLGFREVVFIDASSSPSG